MASHYGVRVGFKSHNRRDPAVSRMEIIENKGPKAGKEAMFGDDMPHKEKSVAGEQVDAGGTSGDPDQGLSLIEKGAASKNPEAKRRRRGFFTENESELRQMEELELP